MEGVCYLPVASITVAAEARVFGVTLLPIDDPRLPAEHAASWAKRPYGCVVAVEVEGSDPKQLAEQAKMIASHALRILRVALRAHLDIADSQLRFRLGESYAFDDRMAGWQRAADAADDLDLDPTLIKLAEAQPVAAMSPEPLTGIDKQADLALRWIERAWFAGEPLVALLYHFFALEALLGDKAEGLKAHSLAFRQMMLSHIVTGEFSHPSRTYFLYDKVRSGAVHGELAPHVSWETTRGFAWLVKQTLDQYLIYAMSEGLMKRGRLLRALDSHPDRRNLVSWLRENGGSEWTTFLDDAERESRRRDP
jgi:hypothetical protein